MPIDIMHRSQELGARIAAARAAQGLSPDALADRLGVRPETVARWEQGSSAPRGNKLQMLAGLLGLLMVLLLTAVLGAALHPGFGLLLPLEWSVPPYRA